MKATLRIRQLDNNMWVAETKKWYWFQWRAIKIRQYETRESLRTGVPAEYIDYVKQGNYSTAWSIDIDGAIDTAKKYLSILGL